MTTSRSISIRRWSNPCRSASLSTRPPLAALVGGCSFLWTTRAWRYRLVETRALEHDRSRRRRKAAQLRLATLRHFLIQLSFIDCTNSNSWWQASHTEPRR